MGGISSTDGAQVQPSNSQPLGSSRGVREVLGEWMVDAVDWADHNRRSLVWGSLLGICSEFWPTLAVRLLPACLYSSESGKYSGGKWRPSLRSQAGICLDKRH